MTHNISDISLNQSQHIQNVGFCEYKHTGLYIDNSFKIPEQLALRTKYFIPAHTVLSIQQCTVSAVRTRTSIQVASELHVEADDCIRFLNHSCQPNAAIISKYSEKDNYATIVLESIRDITMDDEICFDYASTEFTLTKELLNKPCLCNSPRCRGILTGYSELSQEQKQYLVAHIPIAHFLL